MVKHLLGFLQSENHETITILTMASFMPFTLIQIILEKALGKPYFNILWNTP